MITKHISTSISTSVLYIFDDAEQASTFYSKYIKVWMLSRPFQTLNGWTITRTINL